MPLGAPSLTLSRWKIRLEPLEAELAELDSEIERVNTGAFVDADRASEQPLSMRAIGNKQGAIGREAQRKVALLQVERSAVARQVANKTATLQLVMDFTGQDYSNASQTFNDEFRRVTCFTRNGYDWSNRFSSIAKALAPGRECDL